MLKIVASLPRDPRLFQWIAVVEPRATLSDTLNEMLTARYRTAVVIDESGRYSGVVDIDTINDAIRGMRSAEQSRLRGKPAS